jgi:peroxiredoxin family protein
MAGKVSIFLISPTYEKLLSTAVITQGAVAQGMEVFIFASFAQVALQEGRGGEVLKARQGLRGV